MTGPSQKLPYNTQHAQQTDIHASGGIRTRNPSKRAAGDSRLRPPGHWDRITTYRLGNIYPATQPPNTVFTNPHGVTTQNTWIFINSAFVIKLYAFVWAAWLPVSYFILRNWVWCPYVLHYTAVWWFCWFWLSSGLHSVWTNTFNCKLSRCSYISQLIKPKINNRCQPWESM